MKEADVEHDVGFQRDAELVPEAHELHDERLRLYLDRQVCEEPLAELAEREIGRVDDDVGPLPDPREETALLRDRARDPSLAREWVAVPRLREPPDEHLVAGLEEEDPRTDAPRVQARTDRRQCAFDVPRTDVEDDGDPLEPPRIVGDELAEAGQELARQVVDAGVAEVLEELRRGRLARSREPGDDDDALTRAIGRVAAMVGVDRRRHRPVTRTSQIDSS